MFGINKTKINTEEKEIEEVLSRGVEEMIERKSLEEKLKSGKQLRIKLGIDPTSPNIHLGRSIPLLKLKDFQDLGHKIILIIGDYTAVIGDTSDKDSERPMLTEDQVKENLKNYVKQASKVIDIEKAEIHFNSKWLGKLSYNEVSEQANIFSLSDFISRENIKKRLDNGKRVSLRELIYPLMQGYDSVAIKSDIEIGGTDQKFNLLAGREMQRHYNQPPQDILTNPLIEGLDGRKMSSSWGNTINLLDSANDIYGKVMSLHDNLIIKYFNLVTRVPVNTINEYKNSLESGENPKNIKMKLANELVKMYFSEEEANKAQNNFDKAFSKGEIPEDTIEIELSKDSSIRDAIVEAGVVVSNSDWRRLIESNAITYAGTDETIKDPNIKADKDCVLRIGKKRFAKIKLK
jgi:tyrosyl-tRNA synthetase